MMQKQYQPVVLNGNTAQNIEDLYAKVLWIFSFLSFPSWKKQTRGPFFLRSISRPSLLQLKAVIQSVAKWPLYSLSALVVALLKSCPHPRVAVVPGLWPPLCPRPPTATWWPLRPSWPLSTRRMRKARSKPSPECHRRRPLAFFTTWKRPYETGNQSASFKTQSPLSSKAFKSSDNVCVNHLFCSCPALLVPTTVGSN